MKKAFVTGWPIKHSKSPLLHGFWLEQYGINGSYEAIAVSESDFPLFIKSLKSGNFSGGNITIPHKETAFNLINNKDEAAISIGAVNTVWLEQGKIFASNTDAYGFAANLDDYAPQWRFGKTAIVLGAGGASRAVIYAILNAGYERLIITNRTHSRAQNLSEHFGDKCEAQEWHQLDQSMPAADLIVNTTSLGMVSHDDNLSEISLPEFTNVKSDLIVTDIVYTPLETPFLKTAKQVNLKTVDGLGMLLHQAVPGFEKWFGVKPEVTEELRAYILGAQ